MSVELVPRQGGFCRKGFAARPAGFEFPRKPCSVLPVCVKLPDGFIEGALSLLGEELAEGLSREPFLSALEDVHGRRVHAHNAK